MKKHPPYILYIVALCSLVFSSLASAEPKMYIEGAYQEHNQRHLSVWSEQGTSITFNDQFISIDENQIAKESYHTSELQDVEVTAFASDGSESIQHLSFDPNVRDTINIKIKENFFTDFVNDFVVQDVLKPIVHNKIQFIINNIDTRYNNAFYVDLGIYKAWLSMSDASLGNWKAEVVPVNNQRDHTARLKTHISTDHISFTANLHKELCLPVAIIEWKWGFIPIIKGFKMECGGFTIPFHINFPGLAADTFITIEPDRYGNQLPRFHASEPHIYAVSNESQQFWDWVAHKLDWFVFPLLRKILGGETVDGIQGFKINELINDVVNQVTSRVMPVVHLGDKALGTNISSASSSNQGLALGFSVYLDLNNNAETQYARHVNTVHELNEDYSNANIHVGFHTNLINAALAEKRSYLPKAVEIDLAQKLSLINLINPSHQITGLKVRATAAHAPYVIPHGDGYLIKKAINLSGQPSLSIEGLTLSSFGIALDGMVFEVEVTRNHPTLGEITEVGNIHAAISLGGSDPILSIYSVSDNLGFLSSELVLQLLVPVVAELTDLFDDILTSLPQIQLQDQVFFIVKEVIDQLDDIASFATNRMFIPDYMDEPQAYEFTQPYNSPVIRLDVQHCDPALDSSCKKKLITTGIDNKGKCKRKANGKLKCKCKGKRKGKGRCKGKGKKRHNKNTIDGQL